MAASQTPRNSLASLTKKFVRLLATITVFSSILRAYGAHTVNLAWNASPDSTVAGYKIYYGTNASSLSTSSSIDAGVNLTAIVPNLGSGTYYFAATSYNSNGVESDLSNIASTNFVDAPVIIAQSGNVNCTYGTTTNLSVTATGSSLSYQWRFNGTAMVNGGNVSGVTTSSLTFTSAADANAGNYQVVVSNPAGTATSSIMTVTVLHPPVIASQPSSLTRNAGASATFSVGATGSPALTYQWLKNGATMIDGGNVLGSATASLTVGSASVSDAATYQCVVRNSYGNATSATATLTVIVPPTISSQPVSQTLNAGSMSVFNVSATGTAPLTYSWMKNGSPLVNGGNVVGASTASLTINNVASTDSATYVAVVSNPAGTATSSGAALTVVTKPSITSQPTSATANAGNSATFNVAAQGSQPMSYQWLFNATPIGGATSATLIVNNVQSASAGSYTCTVSNQAGSVTSSVAILTVVTGPSITSQPSSVTANAESPATFNIAAQGSQPMSYQWFFNNSPISGANAATLTLNSVQAANAGNYSCTVSNQAGAVTSSAAILTVIVGPSITSQPANATVNVGSSATFNVIAQGSQPMSYQWFFNDYPIAGATATTLSLNNVQVANVGSYSCTVSNQAGSVTSSMATLTTGGNTTIVTQPTNAILNACDTLTLNVVVTGSTTPTYQWMHNGFAIPDATNESYSIAGVTGDDAGTYFVKVTGDSIQTSSNAVVTVNDPTFLMQPGDNCVPVNATNVFIVQACGASLNYQWYFVSSGSTMATAIAGATSPSLTIGPATTANGGQYFCVVTNNFGSITSRAASLGVEAPPTITSQPANTTAIAGGSVTFTIAASASAPLTFQWKKNSKDIIDATNSTYTIDTVQMSDSGTYQCSVGTIMCQSTALSSSSYGRLSVTKPKVNSKFTSPSKNALYSNTSAETLEKGDPAPQVLMSGIASDTVRVVDVAVTRTFPDSAPIVIHPTLTGSPTLSYWTNYVALVPGTNVFAAVVTDAAGLSATNILEVFLRASSVLHLSTKGAGSTTPLAPTTFGRPTNNASLDIGRNYRIFAKAARGNLFSNWVDGSGLEVSTSPTLVFRMQANLQLTANFVTNPVVANHANGSYNGLFYETNEVRLKSAGAIFNLTVRTDGLFSGTMKLDGRSYGLSGAFDVKGNATKHVRRAGKTAVDVTMHLDFDTKQITGTISSPAPDEWTSVLMMDIAPYSARNRFANSARYTLAVPPGAGAPTNSPGGFGYGFVTNNPFGTISLIGALADGTQISQSVPISQQGYWPFYIPLYGNRGLIQGWLNFSGGSPAGNISWIRPAGRLTTTYPNGFTNLVTIFGSPYTPRVPSMTPSDNALDVGYPSLTFPYAVSNNNAVITLPGSPTNYMAGKISAPTGAVSLSYRPTGGNGNLTAHGAVLQWNYAAYGYVISDNISAPLHLH